MLDGLLGRGFTSKCKSLIKLLKARIDMIRRKRSAVQKFLKKDIADLLSNALDINAYGRAEGLLVEMNLSSCYDLVEQFCDAILKQISVMQKQRECPEECKEAVPSLIFAAARFADLPELHDLRQLFEERYGNSLESFLNREFAVKMAAQHPTMEKKLQLMRDIAKEFSIKWDSNVFEEKLSNPPASVQDQYKRHDSLNDTDNGYKSHNDMEDNFPKKDDQHILVTKGRLECSDDGHKVHNSRGETILKRDKQDVPTRGRQELTDNGYKLHNEREDTSHDVSSSGWQVKTNVIDVPLADNNLNGLKNHSHLINNDIEGKKEIRKPFCNNVVPPPYVKPRGGRYGIISEAQVPNSDKSEGSTDPPYSNRDVMRNRSERTEKRLDLFDLEDKKDHGRDDLVGDAMPRPRSVSVRRHSKPSPGHDRIGNSQQEENRNVDSRKEDARRGPQAFYDDDYDTSDEDKKMDELLISYSKKPSTNEPRKMRGLKAPPKNDTAVMTGRSPGHRSTDGTHLHLNTGLSNPLGRAASLPPEPTTPIEGPTGPARASSVQPDGQAAHVHPKLPDYDDLAAQIAALRTM